jgi:hypothetical protein
MSFISLPYPTKSFLDLANFLKEKGSDRDPVQVVAEAVEYWMDNADWKPETLIPEAVRKNQGYSWKTLFLPAGTLVRMKHNGDFHYAQVEGDHLIHDGVSVSPNQFALAVAGHPRDAWRDLWIKRPSDPDYRLAHDLRHRSDADQ